jgi:hypothetical protein
LRVDEAIQDRENGLCSDVDYIDMLTTKAPQSVLRCRVAQVIDNSGVGEERGSMEQPSMASGRTADSKYYQEHSSKSTEYYSLGSY